MTPIIGDGQGTIARGGTLANVISCALRLGDSIGRNGAWGRQADRLEATEGDGYLRRWKRRSGRLSATFGGAAGITFCGLQTTLSLVLAYFYCRQDGSARRRSTEWGRAVRVTGNVGSRTIIYSLLPQTLPFITLNPLWTAPATTRSESFIHDLRLAQGSA